MYIIFEQFPISFRQPKHFYKHLQLLVLAPAAKVGNFLSLILQAGLGFFVMNN